jgi:CDP-glucose 4,6-dehydratase
MHFLVTGHTGFKGAWLCLLLSHRGHQVSGLSVDTRAESLFEKARIQNCLNENIVCDIRDFTSVSNFFKSVNPDVVIHLAAQSLVRESYRDPATTFETNVIGTINVLRASQGLDNLKAQLIVTTDKVYKDLKVEGAYKESDPLGGDDPYSASKAMADIATQSWLKSFENVPTSIARAGNVIGGGDICEDRLIPDLVASFINNSTPQLRYPNAVRPWQHVLDCLNGYLLLIDQMVNHRETGTWNFGPKDSKSKTVAEVTERSGAIWGTKATWTQTPGKHPKESVNLLLDSSKARERLGWVDKLSFEESLEWTINWYRNVNQGKNPREETDENILRFEGK